MIEVSDSPCRMIVDSEPNSGATNMAIDAALLEAADECPSSPVVRIYRWSEPTVTVGYFQKDNNPKVPDGLTMCPRVRRLTGGGAILHHHEITYSCVLPRTHSLRNSPLSVYDVMHDAILKALSLCHVHVGYRAKYPVTVAGEGDEPYLCFLRANPRDLVAIESPAGSYPKVVGSAQRRRRGTLLQHGSILLRASPLLPGVAGISDYCSQFDEVGLGEILPVQLANAVSSSVKTSDYTDHEDQLTLKHKELILAHRRTGQDDG